MSPPRLAQPGWSFRLTLVLTMTTITACLIWLSDEIGRRGIGWGVSLLFFAGLVVGLPGAMSAILEQMRAGYIGSAELAAFVCSYSRRSSCSSIRPGGGAGLGMQAEQGPSLISGRATEAPQPERSR